MKLVFVHGMGHAGSDSEALKHRWVTALNTGLQRAGLEPLSQIPIVLPFYGDDLAKKVQQVESGMKSDLRERGPATGQTGELVRTQRAILAAVLDATGVQDTEVSRELTGLQARDPQNWGWVLAATRALARVPGLDMAIIDAFLEEVSVYLTYPGARRSVDEIVGSEIGEENVVVVGHSLGSVVSYNVLRARSKQPQGSVFITVGSPLGIDGVRNRLSRPLDSPTGVQKWLNAYDPADIVALYPLDEKHFNITPEVTNYRGVKNFTKNRHGIDGYLSDPTVAATIAKALGV